MILNLKKLNKYIDSKHFKMESLQNVLHMVKSGVWIASVDLKDAYYSVPINKEYQKYLEFLWEYPLKFIVMPNGYGPAMRAFTKLMKPPFSFLRSVGYLSVVYVDDCYLQGDSFTKCPENVIRTIDILESLGFYIKIEKSDPALFLLYVNDLPDVVVCDVAINANDTTLCSKCDRASDLWQQLELASELESDLGDMVDWGKMWLVDFNAGKTQLVWFDRSNNNGSIDVKMGGSILEEKLSFKMQGLTFSSKLDWGSCIISIAKTASKKIRALIHSLKFLSPEVALYLNKSTIRPCVEYCCHIWAGAPSCYLDLLDKLQKRICRILGPSLAASLGPLVHC